MKKNLLSKLTYPLILGMTLSVFTGCAGNNQTPTTNNTPTATPSTAPTPVPTPSEEPARDLGGITVVIADWWTDPNAEVQPAKTLQEEKTRAYRAEIQEKHNFTMKQMAIGTYGEFQELFITSTMAGDPLADIFIMDSSFIAQPMAKGLLYPLSTLESYDFQEIKWNPIVRDIFTVEDVTYGMQLGQYLGAQQGLFFNKRLFEEAGLNPDVLYDMQKSGELTWDTFKEIAKQLTYDKNNDGVPDTYALASFDKDFYRGAIFSNDSEYFSKDASGKFTNNVEDPKLYEALQYVRSFFDEGLIMPQPEGSEWNWFNAAFHDGQVAMTVAKQSSTGTWADMTDDWGFVLFPKGPKGDYMTAYNPQIIVMPTGMDPDKADAVAFAYNLWTNPADPDAEEDPEGWKVSQYPNFRDARAVDETLQLVRDGHGKLLLENFIYGVDVGDLIYNISGGSETPAEASQKVKPIWDALVNDANSGF